MTDTVTEMEAFVRRAEEGETEHVESARLVLAEALINKRPVDEDRLTQLTVRVGKNGIDPDNVRALFLWSPLATACSDYIHHKQVGMGDGRCATADGWNYENCEPDDLHCSRIDREVSERLQAHVATLTDEEPSNDPEHNPSEYDLKFDTVVEEALRQYLDSK